MKSIRTLLRLAALAVCLGLALPASAAEEKPIRVLIVLGGCCHDYARQQKILSDGLAARANVVCTVAYDPNTGTNHLNPVYQNKDWAKDFDVVVHDECSADVKDLGVIEDTILKPHKDGLPAVVLHCGMHSYRSEGWLKVVTPWFEFTGLQTTGHGAQQPIAVTYVDKESPITKGLEDWTTVNEELYNNIAGQVLDTARPLARGKQGKDETVVAWTNLYKGKTKVFATTLGHNNQTVADGRYLDLVTRGLLWSVGKLDEQHLKPAAKGKPAAEGVGNTSAFKADAAGLVPADLAHGKAATASSFQADGDHVPAAAFDGDLQTRWCANGDGAPQWLRVDLGKPQDVVGCRITWESEANYRYKVEGSADGNEWAVLADEASSDTVGQVREHEFVACCGAPPPGKGVRFVRLNVTGLQPGRWASLYEFEVFGSEKVKPAAGAAASAGGAGRRILAGLKAPAGFELTVFAAPPDVNYPTCVAAAPTGEVFVGVDEMGSLGRKAGRGRVVRCVDTDGDGKADRFTDFAKMDHPRGLAWDGATGTLYVLHPPFLTAYHDDNGDGVSDRSDVLVKGIANEKIQAERGADHTTNGIRLGIDGWIYVAMGDFGCTDAVGTDGTHLTRHGGGIVRVRPDGSGLEEFTRGQRNIYDVAVDPLMNAFTRDNTNDGDGWDVRLSYVVPTGDYGYPRLFKNFPGEIVKPMLDLGGGSPCGSLYVDEPGLPGDSGRMLYTVEWGRSAVMRHPLTPAGAGFEAKEEKWFDLPRGTDMDVDGAGRFYLTSWSNGGFDYSGPDVGYVVRLAAKGAAPSPFPDLKKLNNQELAARLASPGAVLRSAAQRELLLRGKQDAAAAAREVRVLVNEGRSPEARAAAVFTLKLLLGSRADDALAQAAARVELREVALRALADRRGDAAVPVAPFLAALQDPSPRVRTSPRRWSRSSPTPTRWSATWRTTAW
jgi:type 1 glutamine amidotransferase